MNKTATCLALILVLATALPAMASIETKGWSASDEAKQFVADTIVIGFLAGPWQVGRTEDITPQHCADMIEYYVKLVGVDHVGIATDDMFTTEPTKIYGGNKMRVYREVWEGIAPEDDPLSPADRAEQVDDLRRRIQSR